MNFVSFNATRFKIMIEIIIPVLHWVIVVISPWWWGINIIICEDWSSFEYFYPVSYNYAEAVINQRNCPRFEVLFAGAPDLKMKRHFHFQVRVSWIPDFHPTRRCPSPTSKMFSQFVRSPHTSTTYVCSRRTTPAWGLPTASGHFISEFCRFSGHH